MHIFHIILLPRVSGKPPVSCAGDRRLAGLRNAGVRHRGLVCHRPGEIARLGRAAGIDLLLCAQRPVAEAVPGQLKDNPAGTAVFRVRSEVKPGAPPLSRRRR